MTELILVYIIFLLIAFIAAFFIPEDCCNCPKKKNK